MTSILIAQLIKITEQLKCIKMHYSLLFFFIDIITTVIN